MKLKKIVLRGENSTMSTNEMKLVLGGQVIDNGVCGLKMTSALVDVQFSMSTEIGHKVNVRCQNHILWG